MGLIFEDVAVRIRHTDVVSFPFAIRALGKIVFGIQELSEHVLGHKWSVGIDIECSTGKVGSAFAYRAMQNMEQI